MNVYNLENESCPDCDTEGELTFNAYCRACHCGNCGKWISLGGEVLEDE